MSTAIRYEARWMRIGSLAIALIEPMCFRRTTRGNAPTCHRRPDHPGECAHGEHLARYLDSLGREETQADFDAFNGGASAPPISGVERLMNGRLTTSKAIDYFGQLRAMENEERALAIDFTAGEPDYEQEQGWSHQKAWSRYFERWLNGVKGEARDASRTVIRKQVYRAFSRMPTSVLLRKEAS